MCPWWGGGGTGGWVIAAIMALIWLAVLGAIIGVIIWAIKSARTPAVGGPESALDVLKRRYAAGEITKEEFDRIRQDIT